MVLRLGLLPQQRKIVEIHCEDAIVNTKVFCLNPARAKILQRESAARCRFDRAPVWRRADMVSMGSCRVDKELRGKASLANHVAEYTFGSRRPADIAHADKENGYFAIVCVHTTGAARQLSGAWVGIEARNLPGVTRPFAS